MHYAIHPGAPDRAPLVLLHGSEGDETSLLGLARRVAPRASWIALRGDRRSGAGYAFFDRFPDRSLDRADLEQAASALVALIRDLALQPPPVLLGMSNGAIAAVAMVALGAAKLCSAAVLLRPLAPFPDRDFPVLAGFPVLVLDAREDPRRDPADAPELVRQLAHANAHVVRIEVPGGHATGPIDETLATAWLEAVPSIRQS